MIMNPFPGPRPYRAADRECFFGRADLAQRLVNNIVANRCITVYGPSGAGKSSLLQAAVLPELIAKYETRVVCVDGWPANEIPTAWLAGAIRGALRMDMTPSESDIDPAEAALTVAQRASRRSSRLLVVCLDQLEQLLYPGRILEDSTALFNCIDRLSELPIRNVRVVLSLREDYLGRFRSEARDLNRLLDHGFRVDPLTVAELGDAVCQAAARGEPPQQWSADEIRTLMLQVRVPGQAANDGAEAQAAYAQIVCRALFQARSRGETEREIEAEPILRRYLDATLTELGPLGASAQRLLEDQFITPDGSRTLRTEKELLDILPHEQLRTVLQTLEGAAVLRAEQHQGSRYFELGHDWLARKLHEQRKERHQEAERRRQEEAQREELRQQAEIADARLAKERGQRRRLAAVALLAIVVAAGMGALGFWAWTQKSVADQANCKAQSEQKRAERQKLRAEMKRREAHDAQILAGVRELRANNQISMALKLLPEVESPNPSELRGWVELASNTLALPSERAILRGHTLSLRGASWSADGKRIVTASADGSARIWSADGTSLPILLKGHEKAVLFAAFSPQDDRILTTSEDGSARIWSTRGTGDPLVLKGHEKAVVHGGWSPDGLYVVTAGEDGNARVWSADNKNAPIVLKGHAAPLTTAVFHPDGRRILTASKDKTARIFQADGKGTPIILRGHEGPLTMAIFHPDGRRVLTASEDKSARIFQADGKGIPIVLKGHEGSVYHIAPSPDQLHVATASADGTARVWNADGKGSPTVLTGHRRAVLSVAFRPDGQYIATASADGSARLWAVNGGPALVTFQGHRAPLCSAWWSPDGKQVLTAASDRGEHSMDQTARVWGAERLQNTALRRHGEFIPYAVHIGAGGDLLITAHDDMKIRLWNLRTGEEPKLFEGHDKWIASAALDSRGERLVTASFDGKARVFHTDGQGATVTLVGHKAPVRTAAFSPDGTHIVTSSDDGTALVFRSDGQGTPVELRGHKDWLTSATFSPDGTRILTTSLDRTARIFRSDGTGDALVLQGHHDSVLGGAWSPDGTRVVTISDDRSARIWTAEGKGPIRELWGHEDAVVRVAFSPDGESIATASEDGKLRLWKAFKPSDPTVLEVDASVLALSFVEGGKKLIAVDEAMHIHSFFSVEAEALKRELREANSDCLPPEIRIAHLGESKNEAENSYKKCERSYRRGDRP